VPTVKKNRQSLKKVDKAWCKPNKSYLSEKSLILSRFISNIHQFYMPSLLAFYQAINEDSMNAYLENFTCPFTSTEGFSTLKQFLEQNMNRHFSSQLMASLYFKTLIRHT
jgi:hypothetical protein